MRLLLIVGGAMLGLASFGGAFAASHEAPVAGLARDRSECQDESGGQSLHFLACMESRGWDYFASQP